jgi:plastocyanin
VKVNRTRFAARLLAVVAVATMAAGCSDNAKVGTDVNTNIKDAVKGQRLGETTTTAAPAAGAPKQVALGAPSTTAKPVATTVTTRPPQATTTTAAPKAQDFVVNINGDKSGKTQFEPNQVSVFVGTAIKFVNTDSVARSVKSGDGAAAQFQSPDIPPGGSWVYVPETAGTIPIVDGTRPYATGTLYVSAR